MLIYSLPSCHGPPPPSIPQSVFVLLVSSMEPKNKLNNSRKKIHTSIALVIFESWIIGRCKVVRGTMKQLEVQRHVKGDTIFLNTPKGSRFFCLCRHGTTLMDLVLQCSQGSDEENAPICNPLSAMARHSRFAFHVVGIQAIPSLLRFARPGQLSICVTDFLGGCLSTEYIAVVNSHIHDVKDFLVEGLLGRKPAAGLRGTPPIPLLYLSTTWGMSTGCLSFPFFFPVSVRSAASWEVDNMLAGFLSCHVRAITPCEKETATLTFLKLQLLQLFWLILVMHSDRPNSVGTCCFDVDVQ